MSSFKAGHTSPLKPRLKIKPGSLYMQCHHHHHHYQDNSVIRTDLARVFSPCPRQKGIWLVGTADIMQFPRNPGGRIRRWHFGEFLSCLVLKKKKKVRVNAIPYHQETSGVGASTSMQRTFAAWQHGNIPSTAMQSYICPITIHRARANPSFWQLWDRWQKKGVNYMQTFLDISATQILTWQSLNGTWLLWTSPGVLQVESLQAQIQDFW